ncbi:unnamed protein product [Discosporangium mesarthrocarpum]
MACPFLTPSDVFCLGDGAVAAGSPSVVVKDGLLGRKLALQVNQAARFLRDSGRMKPAGMGRGQELWHSGKIRGDNIMWITDGVKGQGVLPEALESLLQRMSEVGESLRGTTFNGSTPGLQLTGTTSVQLASYSGNGSGYVRHLDTPKGAAESEEADRKASTITAIYYLNPDWEKAMGGQLRIHLGGDGGKAQKGDSSNDKGTPAASKSGSVWDVDPLLDRLVLFRSDHVYHEVLPVYAPRLAVTMWFHGRQAPLTQLPGSPPATSASSGLRSPISLIATEDTRGKVRPLPIPAEEDAVSSRYAKEGTIFVSIVSYRDPETTPTVTDLFERASNPDRVSVGIVWQLEEDEQDQEMLRETRATEPPTDGRIRTLHMPAEHAAGPCWARRVAQSLWRGEEYYLQIDSHMRFRPGWVAEH